MTDDSPKKPDTSNRASSNPASSNPASINPASSNPASTNPASTVRDVADFHLRWPAFRPIAQTLGRNPALSEAESDTLAWMVELLDRIGPQDLDSTPD